MQVLRPDLRRFRSAEPRVTLTKAFSTPFANVVATARTCYSSKGIVGDDQVGANAASIAESIYHAGHHTTFQHAHFQFAMENVSRQFLWAFLHAHPFYNSEQVSQRYVTIRRASLATPPLEGEALGIYEKTADAQVQAYHRLSDALRPVVEREFFKRFNRSERMAKKHNSAIQKRCQEVARYALPVAMHAYLYHTVSGITLLRYWRTCRLGDAPTEQEFVVGRMVEALLEHDRDYAQILEAPIDPDEAGSGGRGASDNGSVARKFREEFDAELNGLSSRLVDWKAQGERLLADGVREALGLTRERMSDDNAIRRALDPALNPLLGESMNLTTLDKVSRAMAHPSYTFRKKISHAGDSQDQRHRMTPASRPFLARHIGDEPDYITPALVMEDEAVRRDYDETMAKTWEAVARLRKLGVEDEFAMYLLPNAVSVRFTESTDLLNLHHKHRMRLCYNAQEEIWRASLEEARQVREVQPRIGAWLLPPCTQRAAAGAKPICPEGDRYCGVRVWKMDIEEYERVI